MVLGIVEEDVVEEDVEAACVGAVLEVDVEEEVTAVVDVVLEVVAVFLVVGVFSSSSSTLVVEDVDDVGEDVVAACVDVVLDVVVFVVVVVAAAWPHSVMFLVRKSFEELESTGTMACTSNVQFPSGRSFVSQSSAR